MDDGRYANNGWLQEFPDPITKLTGTMLRLMSPAFAKKAWRPDWRSGADQN